MSQPKPAEPHKHSEGMDMGGAKGKAQPSVTEDATGETDMSGMTHAPDAGSMETDGLMVMSGEQMDIRV